MIGSLIFTGLITLAASLGGLYNYSHGNISDIGSSSFGSHSSFYGPGAIQQALTPPSSFDLSLGPDYDEDDFWFYKSAGFPDAHEATFEQITGGYHSSYYWRDLLISTTIYAPSSTFVPRSSPMYAFAGTFIGSAASSPAFKRFDIELDNHNSAQAFLFYGDFSSSGEDVFADVSLYDKDNILVSQLNKFVSYYSQSLRGYYVPPYSKVVLSFSPVSSAQYLDGLYIDDIGSTAYDEGFTQGYDIAYDIGYEDGYEDGSADGGTAGYIFGHEDGYNDGYDDGHTAGYDEGLDDANQPWTIMDGISTVAGFFLNALFIILGFEVFGIQLSYILAIIVGIVLVIWLLKVIRG